MLPRWHILFGIAFAALVLIAAPKTNPIFIFLVFFSSILIDFDHYMCSVLKTKKIGIFHSFNYHKEMLKKEKEEKKRGIRERGDFHLFHTVEFHVLFGLLGLWWIGFFYVFLGMIFHSLLDVFSLLYDDMMHRREFFLVVWIWKKLKR